MVGACGRTLIGLSTLCALLVLTASAQADTTLAAQPIVAAADALSGRILTVSCATSTPSWARTLDAAGLPPAQSAEFYGFSVIGRGEMRLSPYVCRGLQLGFNPATRAANVLQVGWAVDVLIHESTHLGRFSSDEALAEACARVGLPGELNRLYGIAYHSAEMSALTLAATWFRRTQGATYQGGSCT